MVADVKDLQGCILTANWTIGQNIPIEMYYINFMSISEAVIFQVAFPTNSFHKLLFTSGLQKALMNTTGRG